MGAVTGVEIVQTMELSELFLLDALRSNALMPCRGVACTLTSTGKLDS